MRGAPSFRKRVPDGLLGALSKQRVAPHLYFAFPPYGADQNHGGHITEPGITADLSAIQDYSDRGFFKRTIRAVNADGVIPGTRDACPSEPGRTIINLSVNSLERPGIPL
jgi:hypothetical protein